MKRKLIKLTILIITFLLILTISNSVFAMGTGITEAMKKGMESAADAANPSNPTSTGSGLSDKINSNFKGGTEFTEGRNAVTKIISSVLGVTRLIGAAVAIIILMTIGAKYLIASAGDRADIKKYAINYIIGAIILFGASGLLTLAKNFVDGAFTTTPQA